MKLHDLIKQLERYCALKPGNEDLEVEIFRDGIATPLKDTACLDGFIILRAKNTGY